MQDLTKGSIRSNLFKMASFMLVSMIFQTLYLLVDLYFVGRLGKEAVAAVSLAGNLAFVVLAMTQMLGVGTTALVSHAVGRKDKDDALQIFNQSQVLSLLCGVAFFTIATAATNWYTNEFSADPITAKLARDYLAWFVPAMGLQFAMVSAAAALRGSGNFKSPMYIQTGTILLNIVLAPVLIMGWGIGRPLGVAGAGLASFIAIVAGVIGLGAYVMLREKYLRFDFHTWRPNLHLWGRMLKIGLPAGAEFGLMWVYLLIVYYVTRPFGAAAQAGFGVGLRIIQAGFLPIVALGFAVSPVGGQNFGAKLPERVRDTFRQGAIMTIVLTSFFTILCQIAPEPMVRFFSSDPQVIAVGAEYLRIISFNSFASGLIFVSSSMFQALGNTLPALGSSAIRILLLAVPALLLSRLPGFQLRWIWYLSVASVLIQMSLNLMLLQREFRRKLTFEPAEVAMPVELPG
jgi:putative MATE family efflux protein